MFRPFAGLIRPTYTNAPPHLNGGILLYPCEHLALHWLVIATLHQDDLCACPITFRQLDLPEIRPYSTHIATPGYLSSLSNV